MIADPGDCPINGGERVRSVTVTFTSAVAVETPVIVWPSVGATPERSWIHIFVGAVVELMANICPVPPVQETPSKALKVPVGLSTTISWVIPRSRSPAIPYSRGEVDDSKYRSEVGSP